MALGRKKLNVAGMIAGFAIGQGALFVSQTALLVSSELVRLGQFGVIFTMLTLVYQGLDCGGLVILSRDLQSRPDRASVGTLFWSFSLFRFMLVPLVVLVIVAIGWLVGLSQFDIYYLAGAAAGMVITTINPGGLLDGHGMSGVTGLSSAAPFLTSAIALPIALTLSDAQAGLLLGCALSFGAILSIGAQFATLIRFKLSPPLSRPDPALVRSTGKEAVVYLLSWMPGQFYFRAEMAITLAALGVVPTGLLLYAKQVIMIPTRLLYFVRRAEFPTLVKRIESEPDVLKAIFRTQRLTTILSLVCVAALALGGLVAEWLFHEHLYGAGTLVALFSPVVFAASLAANLAQGCYACHRTGLAAWSYGASVVSGTGLIAILIVPLGMVGISVANVASSLLSAAVMAYYLKRMRKAAKP